MAMTFKIPKKPDVSFMFSNFTIYLTLFLSRFILAVGLEDSNHACIVWQLKAYREARFHSRRKKGLVF